MTFKKVLGPVLGAAIRSKEGGINLNVIIAKAITMGDEFHQRNIAATLNFLKEVVPYIIALDWDREEIQQVVEFLANTDQFSTTITGIFAEVMPPIGPTACTW